RFESRLLFVTSGAELFGDLAATDELIDVDPVTHETLEADLTPRVSVGAQVGESNVECAECLACGARPVHCRVGTLGGCSYCSRSRSREARDGQCSRRGAACQQHIRLRA